MATTFAPARVRRPAGFAALLFAAASVPAASGGFPEDVAAVVAVGPKGEGNAAAADAVRRLAAADAGRLPALFAAFAEASPVGRNLLAGAAQAVADRADPAALAPVLSATLTENPDPHAAAVAFDLLEAAYPAAAARFLEDRGLASDAPTVRRAAVAAKLADAGDDADALAALLERTLDRDQVEALAAELAAAGRPVDLPTQFGFLTNWQLVGPFDHRGDTAFDRVLPPEETPGAFDPTAAFPTAYPGAGDLVTWQPIETEEDFGTLDVAGAFTNWKGSAVVLARDYDAPRAGPVTFRVGTPNAFKLYLNGTLVFARPEYHRGTKMDQYVIPAEVRAGRNVLMVKLLQNEQEQSWAQDYQLQFRVTDPSGAALREPEEGGSTR